MDMKHIKTLEISGKDYEVRYAGRKTDTWPGYHTPAGKKGFWAGTHGKHWYLGTGKKDVAFWETQLA